MIIRVAGEETRGQLHISDISQGTSLNVPQSTNDQTTEEVTEATEQVDKSTGIPQTVEVVVSTAHGTVILPRLAHFMPISNLEAITNINCYIRTASCHSHIVDCLWVCLL